MSTNAKRSAVRSRSEAEQEPVVRAAERVEQPQATVHRDLGNAVVQRALAGDSVGGLAPMIHAAVDPSGPSNTDALAKLTSGGFPLPEGMRTRFESAFGHDFSHVRIHDDSSAHDAATEISAHAFALGSDIYMGGSTWSPGSSETERLLAHELTHVVQADEGRLPPARGDDQVSSPTDPAEREAYGNENRILGRLAQREGMPLIQSPVGPVSAPSESGAPRARAMRIAVNPTPAARLTRVALLGDGTPGNPGLTLTALQEYVARQADWFSEPSLTATDRDNVWRVLLFLRAGPHLTTALGPLRLAEVAAMPAADLASLSTYAAGFDPAAQNVRLRTPAPNRARALQLGAAMADLASFVPPAVMRVVIPEAGLEWLVDNAKLAELRVFYTVFRPTLENQAEWPHIQTLLTEGVAGYFGISAYVHDLHVFTQTARQRLVVNFGDTSRTKPVMLILMSANDWNAAFLAASNLEAAIVDNHNNTLVIQGPSSLSAATGMVNTIADAYGQREATFDWSSLTEIPPIPRWNYSPGRLGQVVIAGHGSSQTVEMASPGTGATNNNDQNVSYDHTSLDSTTPGSPGYVDTQTLIDTLIRRSEPSGAHIVFAGCLVGSHQFSPGLNVNDPLTAEGAIRADLAANPNLADFVRSRMAAITPGHGDVAAANASTTFGAFSLDPSGRAQLALPGWDPDIGGSKADYLRTGSEPEGALRAAIECYADPAIGPVQTTTLMRARVTALAGVTHWWQGLVRAAFQLALPGAGNVDIAKVLDLSRRVEPWLLAGWPDTLSVDRLVGAVRAGEATTVYGTMFSSDNRNQDHVKVGVREAWLAVDPAQGPLFMANLTASALDRQTFLPMLSRAVVNPRLGTLLTTSATPSRGELLLALTIAVSDGSGMPAQVRDLLRAAAGGARTASFPAARGVPALLAGASEQGVLESIGLAIGAAPVTSGPMAPPSVDANVDANTNGTNESFVATAPREASTTPASLRVRARPNTSSATLDTLPAGTRVRVMGTTGTWSMIDHNGRVGFVATSFLT